MREIQGFEVPKMYPKYNTMTYTPRVYMGESVCKVILQGEAGVPVKSYWAYWDMDGGTR